MGVAVGTGVFVGCGVGVLVGVCVASGVSAVVGVTAIVPEGVAVGEISGLTVKVTLHASTAACEGGSVIGFLFCK